MHIKSPQGRTQPPVKPPVSDFQLANKKYVDDSITSHGSDLGLHLSSAQNAWLDAITATAGEINFVSGVTSNIQDQLDDKLGLAGGTLTGALTLSGDPSTALQAATKQYVDAATGGDVIAHLTNEALHLTSAQNTWLDSITATAAEINFLSGLTSSAQNQLNDKLNLTGGTLTGLLTLSAAPTADLHASTKKYVDDSYAASIVRTNHTGEQAISTVTNLQTQLNYARGLNEGTPDLDPNTTASNVIITNHANSPANTSYWHITTTFYTSITGTANRGQLAIQYNSGISAYVRSCFGGVWTAWTRIDNAGAGTLIALLKTNIAGVGGAALNSAAGSSGLQVMGDATNGAFLSFHRSGIHALNFGLDTDNVIKLGGWSGAGITALSCTTNGNLQARLSISLASEYVIGNITGATTINFTNGQKARATLTGNVTLTLSFPGIGHYQLILVQDATGNRTVSYAATPRFVGRATAPDINVTANSETILSLYWNGTNVYLTGSKVGAV